MRGTKQSNVLDNMKLLKILFLFITFPTFAQEISFVAAISKKIVALDESFEISYTITNAEPRSLQLPDLNIFRLVSGPNQSYKTVINNNMVS